MTWQEEFDIHVKKIKHNNGTATYKCRDGLWSVKGKDTPKTHKKAVWYFILHITSGTYDGEIKR